jgi:ubiquinone/menaquinone biosynthesis C-methylase UbiE
MHTEMKNVERKKLIQQYYSSRAKDYDKQKSRTWKTVQGFGNEVADELLAALKGLNASQVLEVGVGTGRNALPILEGIETYFVGLDLTKEMLKTAKTKMSTFKQSFDLILGDAEHLPFAEKAFDAIVCMSTMHYFTSREGVLSSFSKILKKNGILVYGDLIVHEQDNEKFFETLERTLSKEHAGYYKPSEMRKLLEASGFQVVRTKTVAYRKSYHALIEDKGEYFEVTSTTLHALVQGVTATAKEQYELGKAAMTLYYTIITAKRKNESM